MARPTRKHTSLPGNASGAATWLRSKLGDYLGETKAVAVAREGQVHVFRLHGEAGGGLLAERDERVTNRSGIFRTTLSAWVRRADDDVSYVLEARFHAWDAWAEAEETGDRSLVDGPRQAMYDERDRRTAAIADELDNVRLFQVPAGGVPALLAGLVTADTADLAIRFAPGLVAGRVVVGG